ncbi:hypothetical protein NAT47_01455 [Flavobacterium sp. HXWNR69]|uniref:Uncharacterized protein n=1 Tax=Flavobacterium fragile TaxID=2949085 RepID=A0ABT0TDM2_9FLAO|nr:hypothetical protein [Flavobacterium sp. HXWNR69]MCL9769075.1 hypothetical protein [Flavobacterium sp. HXWNR69]
MKKIVKIIVVFALTLFVWSFLPTNKMNYELTNLFQFELQDSKEHPQYSHFQTVELEESDFVYTELDPDFELQNSWIVLPDISYNFFKTPLRGKSNLFSLTFFSSKETIPLYDLFCNWKFHLS